MNICLVRASQFFRQFCLVIWHKTRKEHILSDALICLVSANTNLSFQDPPYSKLDALFAYNTMLVAMNKNLAQRIVKSYENNPWWVKILSQLRSNDGLGDHKVFLLFIQELSSTNADPYFLLRPTTAVNNHSNENIAPPALSCKLIYYIEHVFGMHCLCLLISIASKLIAIAHSKSHSSFLQWYKTVSRFQYIHGLIKLLRAFLCCCP